MNHKQKKSFVILLSIAGVVAVLALLMSLLSGGENDPDRWFSTYSSNPEGFKAFFLMLSRLGIQVARLKTDITSAPLSTKSLWILNPSQYPKKEIERLKEWVKEGNTLIITKGRLPLFDFDDEESDDDISPLSILEIPDEESAPSGDDILTRQVDKICYCAYFQAGEVKPVAGRKVILSAENTPLVLEESVGEGKIVYLTQPQMFNNRSIGKADNAVLSYNLTYHFSQHYPVYFGEGISDAPGTWHIVFTPPFLWVSLQVILTVLLFVYGAGKRFGPVRPLPIPPRRSKDEYIYAMANLLLKKGNHAAVSQTIKTDFLRHLYDAAHLPRRAPKSQLIEQLHNRYQIPRAGLERLLKNLSFPESLSEKEWLETINQMENVIRELDKWKR